MIDGKNPKTRQEKVLFEKVKGFKITQKTIGIKTKQKNDINFQSGLQLNDKVLFTNIIVDTNENSSVKTLNNEKKISSFDESSKVG